MTEDQKFNAAIVAGYTLPALTISIFTIIKYGMWLAVAGMIGWTVLFGLIIVLFIMSGW